MSEEKPILIKSCPFCGSVATVTHNNVYWYVECSMCPSALDGAFNGPTGQQDAIAAWNRRVSRSS